MSRLWAYLTSKPSVHDHFYGDDKFGPILTIMITCTKGIAILVGIIALFVTFRITYTQKSRQFKQSYILPSYLPLLFLVILSFIIELGSLWLWELHGYHFSYYVIQLILQSFVSDGFVQYLTLSTFSSKSRLRAVLYVFVSACYGAMFGAFMGLEVYPIPLVYATYHFIAALYHVYLFYPWKPQSCFSQKRPGIKQFSQWIFCYRMFWAILSVVRYMYDRHLSSRLDNPLTIFLYICIAFVALLDFPFTLIYFVILRAETKYWFVGEQLFAQRERDRETLDGLQADSGYRPPQITFGDDQPTDHVVTLFTRLVNHHMASPITEFAQTTLLEHFTSYLKGTASTTNPSPRHIVQHPGGTDTMEDTLIPLHDDSLILSIYPVVNTPLQKTPLYKESAQAEVSGAALPATPNKPAATHSRFKPKRRRASGHDFVHIVFDQDSHPPSDSSQGSDDHDGESSASSSSHLRDSFDPDDPYDVVRFSSHDYHQYQEAMEINSDMMNLATRNRRTACCTVRTWNIFTLGLYGFIYELFFYSEDDFVPPLLPIDHYQQNMYQDMSGGNEGGGATPTSMSLAMSNLQAGLSSSPTKMAPIIPVKPVLIHPSLLRQPQLMFMEHIDDDTIIGFDKILQSMSHLMIDNNQLLTEKGYFASGTSGIVFRGELTMKPAQLSAWAQCRTPTTACPFYGVFDLLVKAYQDYHQVKNHLSLIQSQGRQQSPLLPSQNWVDLLPQTSPAALLYLPSPIDMISSFPASSNHAAIVKAFQMPHNLALKHYYHDRSFNLWSRQAYSTHLMVSTGVIYDVFDYAQFAPTIALIESHHENFQIQGILFIYSLATVLFTQHLIHTLNKDYITPHPSASFLRAPSKIPKRIIEVLTLTDLHPFITTQLHSAISRGLSGQVREQITAMNTKRAASLLSLSSRLFSFDSFASLGFTNPSECFFQSPDAIHRYVNQLSGTLPVFPTTNTTAASPSSPTNYYSLSPSVPSAGSPSSTSHHLDMGSGSIIPSAHTISALSGYTVGILPANNTTPSASSSTIPVAVKFFRNMGANEVHDHRLLAEEIRLQCEVRHRHVVYCHGFFVCRPSLAAVFDNCPIGDLKGSIKRQRMFLAHAKHTVAHYTTIREQLTAACHDVQELNLQCVNKQKEHRDYVEHNATMRKQQSQFSTMTKRQIDEHLAKERELSKQVEEVTKQLQASKALFRSLLTEHHLNQRKLAVQTAQLWDLRHRFSLARDAAAAIAHIHDRQLMHRDIKSENYMVGAQDVLLLTDFGVATHIDVRAEELDLEYKTNLLQHSTPISPSQLKQNSDALTKYLLSTPLAYRDQESPSSSSSTQTARTHWVDFSSATDTLSALTSPTSSLLSHTLETLQSKLPSITKSFASSSPSAEAGKGTDASSPQESGNDGLNASGQHQPSTAPQVLILTDPVVQYLDMVTIQEDGVVEEAPITVPVDEPIVDSTPIDTPHTPRAPTIVRTPLLFPIYAISPNYAPVETGLVKELEPAGTGEWMAPEVFSQLYSYPADIYSLGLTIAEILYNIRPEELQDFSDSLDPQSNVSAPASTLHYPNVMPVYIRLLVLACVDPRPECRPSAAQVRDVFELCILLIDFIHSHQSRNLLRV